MRLAAALIQRPSICPTHAPHAAIRSRLRSLCASRAQISAAPNAERETPYITRPMNLDGLSCRFISVQRARRESRFFKKLAKGPQSLIDRSGFDAFERHMKGQIPAAVRLDFLRIISRNLRVHRFEGKPSLDARAGRKWGSARAASSEARNSQIAPPLAKSAKRTSGFLVLS
jgi:hypothetical protein